MRVPTKLHHLSLLPALVALALSSGCSKSTRPDDGGLASVDFAVTATPQSGGPSAPVVLNAVVRNTGTATIWHYADCIAVKGVEWSLIAPDGEQVTFANGVCDHLREVMLEPAGEIDQADTFTGGARAGTYTLVAHFSYWTRSSSAVHLERRTTFTWAP